MPCLTSSGVAWGRGENISGKRERNGRILGDIIHATPVVVGKPRSFFAPMSFGNCGYALPTIIGAKAAAPDRPAIAYAGDGQHQDTGAKMIHVAPHTTSRISSEPIQSTHADCS